MSDLPVDLVEEILSRVPATYLKRLRSTCKHWNALFKNKGFTEKHFLKAAKQSLVLVLNNYKVYSVIVNLNVVAPSIEFKGELSLKDSHYNSEGVKISRVFHCDGLLLCTTHDNKLAVWNPCLGETRWINLKNHNKVGSDFALGYENNKSCRTYKLLRCWDSFEPPFNLNYVVWIELYEFGSDSWRALDRVSCNYLVRPVNGVSLKGNTYWLSPSISNNTFLASFDFTTERFKRLNLPPFQDLDCKFLSVVREEQLSLSIQKNHTSEVEIWMAKYIDTEATVSWSKSFTVDIKNLTTSFPVLNIYLIDEEKRVIMCCGCHMVGIIGEDDAYYTKFNFDKSRIWSLIFNYVPSLVQIQ